MKEIIDKIIEEGFECYIVGGYVRDYLLGYDSKDRYEKEFLEKPNLILGILIF